MLFPKVQALSEFSSLGLKTKQGRKLDTDVTQGNHFTKYYQEHDVLFHVDTENIISIPRLCQQDGKKLILNSNLQSNVHSKQQTGESTEFICLYYIFRGLSTQGSRYEINSGVSLQHTLSFALPSHPDTLSTSKHEVGCFTSLGIGKRFSNPHRLWTAILLAHVNCLRIRHLAATYANENLLQNLSSVPAWSLFEDNGNMG